MKKRILSLALVVVMVALVAAGSLAYFTDTDSEKNTFTVGKVDIDVSETNKINGVEVTGNEFANVMPGTKITKTAVVTNNSSEDAYVRVVVHLNHHLGLYTMLGLDNRTEDHDIMLARVKNIMPGWDIDPQLVDGWYGMNYKSTKTSTTGVEVISVDEVMVNNQSGKYFASGDNYFKTDAETVGNNGLVTLAGGYDDAYYADIVYYDHVAWVYYLKMAPGASFTLFEGINSLESFGAKEMSFFDDNLSPEWQQENLEINVCADAIQSTGFTDAKAAFEELDKAHDLSAWDLR